MVIKRGERREGRGERKRLRRNTQSKVIQMMGSEHGKESEYLLTLMISK